jgi:UDP-glucose 4-epimerase
MDKIIVTGAAGFIGSNLCISLIEKGHTVVGIDNLSRGEKRWLNKIINHPKFLFLECSIEEGLRKVESEPLLTIVHLASEKIPRYDSGWKTLKENEFNSNLVINFSIKYKARLLFASTSDVYGNNKDVPFSEESNIVLGNSDNKRWNYALSKLHTEHLLFAANREFNLQFNIMRFFGCYGPHQALGWWGGPQSVFIQKLLNNEKIEIHGTGNQTRSYLFINDLIDGIIQLINNNFINNEVFNFCRNPDDEISVFHLAELINEIIFHNKSLEYDLIEYASFGKYDEVMRRVGSPDKAKRLLNWEAKTDLKTGLIKTIEWEKLHR